MAGFAAHEIFGQEVSRRFTDEELLTIVEEHRGIFGIGCQGPDLFLYDLPMLACGDERNVGARMHQEGTARFFAYLWQTVWEAECSLQMEVGLAYLYGALAHYTLDTMMHPYIYARIGYDPEVPYSKKATRGQHHRLEAAIDAKLLSVKRDALPSQYKPCESMDTDKRERECLADLLVRAVGRTYKVKLKRENVFGAIKMMKMIACGFYGGSERKRKMLEKWEHWVTQYGLFSNLMVTDDDIRKRKVMNHEKMPWKNPWDASRESQDSVWEIYQNAVERYGQYRREFEQLEEWVLARREELACREEEENKKIALGKNKRKKLDTSVIMEQLGREENKVSAEIRRSVKKLGNLSYYSGLPL